MQAVNFGVLDLVQVSVPRFLADLENVRKQTHVAVFISPASRAWLPKFELGWQIARQKGVSLQAPQTLRGWFQ